MKGFPNQISDLCILTSALKILFDLVEQGKNSKDDGVFGEALIRRKILRTGRNELSIEEYLAEQKKKNPSNQSFRTSARGLRELFRVLSLIDDSDDNLVFTPKGYEILSVLEGALDENALNLWRNAILDLHHYGEDDLFSNPYQVLLRLVAKRPGISRAKCALALEARDNSGEELDRIVSLSDLEEDEIYEKLGITKSTWDNAKKIFPSFAEQLGDVRKEKGCFFLSETPGQEVKVELTKKTISTKITSKKPRSPKRVSANTIASTENLESWDEFKKEPPFEELHKAALGKEKKIKDRWTRHNLIVQALALLMEKAGYDIYEFPFDCLACLRKMGFLFEVKSLDGTNPDEKVRVREALGQLLYYEAFAMAPVDDMEEVIKIACFEGRISDQHISWLENNGVLVIWKTEEGFDGAENTKRKLAGLLGF